MGAKWPPCSHNYQIDLRGQGTKSSSARALSIPVSPVPKARRPPEQSKIIVGAHKPPLLPQLFYHEVLMVTVRKLRLSSIRPCISRPSPTSSWRAEIPSYNCGRRISPTIMGMRSHFGPKNNCGSTNPIWLLCSHNYLSSISLDLCIVKRRFPRELRIEFGDFLGVYFASSCHGELEKKRRIFVFLRRGPYDKGSKGTPFDSPTHGRHFVPWLLGSLASR